MKIQEQDIYHGPGLVQIVEHKSFKALNRASSKYGHYLVNTDRHVFAKYSTKKKSPWHFTFQLDDLRQLRDANGPIFVMLTCGTSTVCALTMTELRQVIDLNDTTQQNLVVTVPSGGSCHVHGTAGKMKRTVPHNAFPDKIFKVCSDIEKPPPHMLLKLTDRLRSPSAPSSGRS